MNSSKSSLSGISNDISFLNCFQSKPKHFSMSKKSWNSTWENWFEFYSQINILGIVNSLKEILNIFSSHIGILFSNIFKVIKLAHFSALDSGLIWLFIRKYENQDDISLNVLWLVSAFFFICWFCFLVRSFTAINQNFTLYSILSYQRSQINIIEFTD